MNRLTRWFADAGIATRLLFWFLAISLVPCLLLAGVTTFLARRSLELSVRDRLTQLAESKTAQLESFVRERRSDARVLGVAPGTIQALTQLSQALEKHPADSPEYRRVADEHRPYLTRFVEIYGYRNLHIFDIRGVLLLSHEPFLEPGTNVLTGALRGTEAADVFERSRALLHPSLSNYQIYQGRKEPVAFMAGPIMKEGVALGIAVFEFGNTEVFRLFNDYTGLGATGETLVAMRIGDEVTFVARDALRRTRPRSGAGSRSAARRVSPCSGPSRGSAGTASWKTTVRSA